MLKLLRMALTCCECGAAAGQLLSAVPGGEEDYPGDAGGCHPAGLDQRVAALVPTPARYPDEQGERAPSRC